MVQDKQQQRRSGLETKYIIKDSTEHMHIYIYNCLYGIKKITSCTFFDAPWTSVDFYRDDILNIKYDIVF